MHRYKMSAPMKNVSPTGKLVFERSSFLNEKGKHRKRIFEHPFNSSVKTNLLKTGTSDRRPDSSDEKLPGIRKIDHDLEERKWFEYITHYMEETELKSTEGNILDPSLEEFEEKCIYNKEKFYSTFPKNDKLEVIFFTPKQRQEYRDIGKQSKEKIQEAILKLLHVHIMLPECSQIPKLVDNLLSDEQAYFTQQVPLDKLLDIDFIEGFIKAGSVQMISQGTSVDADDCVALLPTGKLVLNLCKDTFQQLGLNGQPSKAGKNTGKYVVQIDTLAEKFYPGMKQYERVKWCLTQLSHTDFLVTWKPNDEKVCPSSIQNYFINKGLQCSRLKLSKTVHEFRDINVPIIDSEVYYPNSDQEYCGYEEMFEWLGACAVGIDLYEGDGYVSTYSCPCPSREIKCCVGSQYGGFIHPDTVQQTIDSLRKYMKEKKLPWCSVTVNGFMDTPLSWQNDHGFHRNGDNLYTLLMFKNEDYWLFSAIGGCDICP